MDKLLRFLVESIVTTPDGVAIDISEENDLVNLKLTVNPEDMKIVIGKQGRTIRAIRHLVRLKALRDNKRVNLVLEDGRPAGETSQPAATGQ